MRDSQLLWMFLASVLADSVFTRMESLAGGEEGNGLELWRVLYVNNAGGADEVEVADLGALHSFPACPNPSQLSSYLGLWMSLVGEQG